MCLLWVGRETWREGTGGERSGIRADGLPTAVRQETRDDRPVQGQDPG